VPAALTLLTGCSEALAPRVEIAAHYVPACAPTPDATPSRLALSALGDFDASNESVAILRSDAARQSLELPEGTLAAELSALDGQPYWGSGTRDAYNRIPILLWPVRRACSLVQVETSRVDAETWLAGGSDRLGALLLLGAGGEAFRVDLASGAPTPLEARDAPRVPRRGAALSELGERLLLSGGSEDGGAGALATAELFDPVLERFTGEMVGLARPRARHAAVTLPGGSSLLIGGESEAGAALGSVEVVSPGAGRAPRAYELLADARIAPRAVLLGQDRVLVGGGYRRDASGTALPVASVEILHTDVSLAGEATTTLAPGALDRAFAALGPGSALAVGGCEPNAAPGADCIPCELGCVSRAVYWLDSAGGAHELEPLPETLSVAAPELVSGSSGSPWLIAGARLGHFDPWLERFEVVDPGLVAAGAALGGALALRPGLFAWLATTEAGLALVGLQHDQRGPWARDVAPLLVGSATGLVPDRPPSASGGDDWLVYTAAGGLELSGPRAIVSVTETEYADFSLELTLTDGPPPLVRLLGAGSEAAAFGGLDCPWPTDGGGARPARLALRRSVDQVLLERPAVAEPATARVTCQRPLPARVSVQLIGTRDGLSRLARVELTRSAE
jgi:hypothetical protein